VCRAGRHVIERAVRDQGEEMLTVPRGLVSTGCPERQEIAVELGDQPLPVKEVHLRALRSAHGDLSSTHPP
jgi:hypothetical protein